MTCITTILLPTHQNNMYNSTTTTQVHNTVHMKFEIGSRKRIKQRCVLTFNNSAVRFRWLSFESSVTFHNSSKSSKSPYDITENVFNTFLTAGNRSGSVPGTSLCIFRHTVDYAHFWNLKDSNNYLLEVGQT